jgi:hypothetical protein
MLDEFLESLNDGMGRPILAATFFNQHARQVFIEFWRAGAR